MRICMRAYIYRIFAKCFMIDKCTKYQYPIAKISFYIIAIYTIYKKHTILKVNNDEIG